MKLILDRWQGLGDNLQLSTIPRRYFEKYGERCVWISDANPYRSPEIRKLVWENNPFIAGFTREPGINLTSKLQFGKYNWIEQWERLYGIDPPYSFRPEIHCENLKFDLFNVQDSILVDISYSTDSYKQNIESVPGRKESLQKLFFMLLSQSNKPILQIKNKQLNSNRDFVNFLPEINSNIDIKTVEVNSIEEYCNAIKWARQFVCTHTGTHPLAAAVRKDTICFIPSQYVSMMYFTFDNVRYMPI